MTIENKITLMGLVVSIMILILTYAAYNKETKDNVRETFSSFFKWAKFATLKFLRELSFMLIHTTFLWIYVISWHIFLNDLIDLFGPDKTLALLYLTIPIMLFVSFDKLFLAIKVRRLEKIIDIHTEVFKDLNKVVNGMSVERSD